MVNKEVIKLDKVPEGKERIYIDVKMKVGINWNYDIVENTMKPTNHKAHCFFENNGENPKDLISGLNSYLKLCFQETDGIIEADNINVEFNIQAIPVECRNSYDKFLKAHAESEKLKVKKEIEELENKAKQLKEKLKKL